MTAKVEMNETEQRLIRVSTDLEKSREKFLFLSETSYTNRILAEGFLCKFIIHFNVCLSVCQSVFLSLSLSLSVYVSLSLFFFSKSREKFIFLSETSYTNRILAEGFLCEFINLIHFDVCLSVCLLIFY
jgi:hypothetical protein